MKIKEKEKQKEKMAKSTVKKANTVAISQAHTLAPFSLSCPLYNWWWNKSAILLIYYIIRGWPLRLPLAPSNPKADANAAPRRLRLRPRATAARRRCHVVRFAEEIRGLSADGAFRARRCSWHPEAASRRAKAPHGDGGGRVRRRCQRRRGHPGAPAAAHSSHSHHPVRYYGVSAILAWAPRLRKKSRITPPGLDVGPSGSHTMHISLSHQPLGSSGAAKKKKNPWVYRFQNVCFQSSTKKKVPRIVIPRFG